MFEKLEALLQTYKEIEESLSKEETFNDPKRLKELSTKRSELYDLITHYLTYKDLQKQINETNEILNGSDLEMIELAKEELVNLEDSSKQLEDTLKELLIPKDPMDDKNVMIEIRAGAGGDEASIFASDVLRMYQNYCKDLGFLTEITSVSQGDEGLKEVIFSVLGKGAYGVFKYESGVHRVQRVPKTETQGRVHTSTITVAVMPEASEFEFELDLKDVRIDVYRAGGHGGQSVNTTDSAVRVTHIPTGTVVAIQDEKSQIKNKAKALKILTNRIYDKMMQERKQQEDAMRSKQVGRGDRSERIRTYNFPQGRLTDHRINLTLYSLDRIIEGDLTPVTKELVAYNRLQALSE